MRAVAYTCFDHATHRTDVEANVAHMVWCMEECARSGADRTPPVRPCALAERWQTTNDIYTREHVALADKNGFAEMGGNVDARNHPKTAKNSPKTVEITQKHKKTPEKKPKTVRKQLEISPETATQQENQQQEHQQRENQRLGRQKGKSRRSNLSKAA